MQKLLIPRVSLRTVEREGEKQETEVISSIMAKLKICRKTMHFEVYTYYFFFHSKMIFLIFEFQPCISLSFDNWQNKSQEKKHFPFEKGYFLPFHVLP